MAISLNIHISFSRFVKELRVGILCCRLIWEVAGLTLWCHVVFYHVHWHRPNSLSHSAHRAAVFAHVAPFALLGFRMRWKTIDNATCSTVVHKDQNNNNSNILTDIVGTLLPFQRTPVDRLISQTVFIQRATASAFIRSSAVIIFHPSLFTHITVTSFVLRLVLSTSLLMFLCESQAL